MLKNFLKNIIKFSEAQYPWTPAEQIVVKDLSSKQDLHTKGYTIPIRLSDEKVQQLKDLYKETHQFDISNGGMFYSVYSDDLAYREKVHHQINSILSDTYHQLFENYKVIISSFIAKVNGPESEFNLHQDSTGLDELKYSPLSVWIPLQDTSIENGCLAVVPKSFHFFSPYRGISFHEPFHQIQDEVKHYLQPIELKAGDVLLFDNRLVHYSPPNHSSKDRIVVMSGIFPQDATIISCYKEDNKKDEIEIFEQADDYLLTFRNFFHNCTCRPETGVFSKKVKWPIRPMNRDAFIQLAKKNDIPRISHPALIQNHKSHIISEPIQK